MAAVRLFLGRENAAETLVAYSSLVQSYLPPIDTVHAAIKTKSGVVGSFSFSVGSHMENEEDYVVACEKGCVAINPKRVKVTRVAEDGKKETEAKEFEFNSGVTNEVQAWAEALQSGEPNPLQSPEEALADLEMLEKIFRSGEEHGSQQSLNFQ